MNWGEIAYLLFVAGILQFLCYSIDSDILKEECHSLPQKMQYNPIGKSKFFCKFNQVWEEKPHER